MEIEIVGQEKQNTSFDKLEPGTIFEFDAGDELGKGPKALKLSEKNYVLLSYSNDNHAGYIDLGDGSMISYGVRKVYGKLVGVKVQA